MPFRKQSKIAGNQQVKSKGIMPEGEQLEIWSISQSGRNGQSGRRSKRVLLLQPPCPPTGNSLIETFFWLGTYTACMPTQ